MAGEDTRDELEKRRQDAKESFHQLLEKYDPKTRQAMKDGLKAGLARLRSEQGQIVANTVTFAQFLQKWKHEGVSIALAWARENHPWIYNGYMDARKTHQARQHRKQRRVREAANE